MSRICEGLDERVVAFRNRALGDVALLDVYLDARYINVRDRDEVEVNRAARFSKTAKSMATARTDAKVGGGGAIARRSAWSHSRAPA